MNSGITVGSTPSSLRNQSFKVITRRRVDPTWRRLETETRTRGRAGSLPSGSPVGVWTPTQTPGQRCLDVGTPSGRDGREDPVGVTPGLRPRGPRSDATHGRRPTRRARDRTNGGIFPSSHEKGNQCLVGRCRGSWSHNFLWETLDNRDHKRRKKIFTRKIFTVMIFKKDCVSFYLR